LLELLDAMGRQVSRRTRDDAADRERFEEIYTGTRSAVLAYLIRRTGTVEDAADLLSEVYLVAWRRIGAVPRGSEARLWLFGVARRVLANQRRRVRSEVELAAAIETALRTGPSAHEVARPDGGREAEVVDALAALSPADRELLMLSGWEELTPAEIAVVLGRPAGLIRVRLHRARARLQATLLEGSVEDPTGRLVPE
jgi:RNA polymerase sigma-70 factor (ECF subfamily)